MKKNLLNDLCNLTFDKDFQALSTRCSEDSVFELITMDENRKSDILSWLLNPAASHQLNGYFLKALLNYTCNSASPEQIKNFKSLFNIATLSTSNSKIIRELSTGKGRIDIAVFIPNEKTVIVIERKDGTSVHNNQLKSYADWVDSNYEKWNKVFILSDSYLKHHEEYDDRFVHIDDTWLEDALDDLFNRGLLNNKQEIQLKDLCQYVFGDWSEKREPYYREFNSKLNQISKSHCNTIRALETEKIKVGNKNIALINITPDVFFGKIIPKCKLKSEELKICEVIQQNHEIFAHLHGLNEFDLFNEELTKSFPHFVTCIYYDSVILMYKKHQPSSGAWPYYLKFERTKNEVGSVFYKLSINVSRRGDERYHSITERVADIYQMKRQSNWKYRHLDLITDMEKIELEDGNDMCKKINEFEKAIKDLDL
ncbi:PD-(D/E)XK nuclease family protein [Endozoicomonas sp. G2_1]|uniref:PD-(D/E)XK nuclease family protein n=1 Tax=Endozoicomonas sp. G2_1 TaxID=2821091 RepID=UPI001ADA2986|nr:PD-(D/E)XK nuclease family protein [Endozoicomonas sp. G2_1]MBO9490385.1 PD-(D/E)XK nuclease family protein [Endozoicomonas sp. G2_1]